MRLVAYWLKIAILEEQNFNDKFSALVLGFLNLTNLSKFKAANDSIFSSAASPRHNLSIEICKVSPLDAANQLLIRSKVLGDHVYDTSEHFFKKIN